MLGVLYAYSCPMGCATITDAEQMIAAFFVEAIAWSFPFSYGVFLDSKFLPFATRTPSDSYYLSGYLDDPVYASQKNAASLLPLVGTISSGIQYCSGLSCFILLASTPLSHLRAGPFLYPIIIKYPQVRLPAVWLGAALCASSLFAASYTTQVSRSCSQERPLR